MLQCEYASDGFKLNNKHLFSSKMSIFNFRFSLRKAFKERTLVHVLQCGYPSDGFKLIRFRAINVA